MPLSTFAYVVMGVLVAWWLSTGLVLGLVWLGPTRKALTMWLASFSAVAGLFGVLATRRETTASGVVVAFASSLALWAWHELSFLQGVVTGPMVEACPRGTVGWRRFKLATLAVIDHELALAITVAGLLGLTWGMPNQVATSLFAAMWLLRLSAKLNLFLGVRNLSEEFIPAHLQYLRTFFRKARLNPLMPVSIVSGALAAAWLVGRAFDPAASAPAQLGSALVGTMVGLGVLEHIFLTAPLGDGALWRWIIRTRVASAEVPNGGGRS